MRTRADGGAPRRAAFAHRFAFGDSDQIPFADPDHNPDQIPDGH
jgi:D-serine dehydratase